MVLKNIEMRLRTVSEVRDLVMPPDIREWLNVQNKVVIEYRTTAHLVIKSYARQWGSSYKESPRMAEIFMHR